MNYELKHFDTTLIRFSATEDSNTPEIHILWQNDEQKNLFPLDLDLSGDGISKWLKHRTIPKNRAYVHNFLSKCGLHLNRPINIINVSKGLSLNDCYWVVEEGFDGKFADFNLYDNRFSQILALIAFTGYGSSIRTSLASCPEFTTNGMLPKCWRRDRGQIKLFKGGTSGASNTGNEPYSEFYAFQIAEIMGIKAIPYNLTKWKGELCSTCDIFTNKNYSFLPVGRIITSGGMNAVKEFYESLGSDFLKAFDDMIVFDALIFNTDRHFGNFGFLVDNNANKIAAPAPLFDHGNSLFNFAGRDDLTSDEALEQYADTLLPCVYDDFVLSAKKVLTPAHKEGLRHLLNFKFKKHSRYNLPPNRLKLIEKQIHRRAKELLE
ncbi:MAG: XRE family transcriptional regulator [Clostridia bacterium]|nr:XRE family transcriptional regulator [Clostridia bacterium]